MTLRFGVFDHIEPVPGLYLDQIYHERLIQIETLGCVEATLQLGIHPREFLEGTPPLFRDEVPETPSVFRLVNLHGVTAIEELTCDPAQEMRVSVVPIGNQGVAKQHDAHGTTTF